MSAATSPAMAAGRFSVTYRILAADEAAARARAEGVALEQTVEIPADVVPAGFIADEVVGHIERLEPAGDGAFDATISYLDDCAGPDLPQFFNTVFGNSSIQAGIRVVGLDLSEGIRARFPGARFGIEGLRALTGRASGPLFCSVTKPIGLDADALGDLAYKMALGGCDLIKDDHGIADQPFARFEERIAKAVAAVARGNRESGGRTLFFANLLGPFDQIERRARFARDAGADGYMLLPGITGFDAMRWLAANEDFRLPIISHPAFLGANVVGSGCGFSHGIMFGLFQRLAGADVSVFPNVGGRFGFSADECRDIADRCRDPAGPGRPVFPAPGGGLTLETLPKQMALYGEDVCFLLGGSLLRAGPRITEVFRDLRARCASVSAA